MTYTETPVLKGNKLCISNNMGGVMHIGIRQARASIKQIEASKTALKPSTQKRLETLKAGVALWEESKRG